MLLITLATAASTTRTIQPSARITTLSTRQTSFVNTLLPKIDTVNRRIASDRSRLLTLKQQLDHHTSLTQNNNSWLIQLAKRYNISTQSGFDQPAFWKKLLNRIDTIPAPLVIAQAANESAWGRSRFAKEGNNYFGQWCTRPGCGLVPRQRPAGKSYEIRKFNSAQTSIASYIHNLNTHRAYTTLRKIRAEKRSSGLLATSLELSQGLSAYSERGAAYIRSIRSIIINYQLAELVQKRHTVHSKAPI